jgi:hypothetical protein
MRTICILTGLSLTAVLSVASASGADPRLMNLVMPDARVVAGVNVTNARITPFGQYLLSQITSTMDQQMSAFVAATGFDPRQDVSELVAASSGNLTTPSGVVVALGNFKVDQLTAAMAKSPQFQLQNYGGATLVTGGAAGNSYSVAFLGDNIAVAGDAASVKAAVDRSASVNSINPALATRAQALSTTEDAWAVTLDSIATLIPGLTGGPGGAGALPIGQMLSGIQASSGGVKFGANVDIVGQAIAVDESTAKSLSDVLKALVSIAAMGGAQDPQMAALAKLLQGLKVSADGTTINLALSAPEAQLEAVVNSMTAQAKAAALPAARAPRAAPAAK